MAKKTSTKSVKRFGPRYGRSTKFKVGKLESQYRNPQKCPYCNKTGVRRHSAGIWHCTKCDSTFTGKAYQLVKKPRVKAEELPQEEEVMEESEEDETEDEEQE